MSEREQRFARAAQQLGYDFSGEILIGGHYVSLIQHGDVIEISGQIPRVGSEVVVTGCVGDTVTLPQAQTAAKVCVMRAMALLARHLQAQGGLDAVAKILKLNVYVQSAANFTQQSEVADGASDLCTKFLAKWACIHVLRWGVSITEKCRSRAGFACGGRSLI